MKHPYFLLILTFFAMLAIRAILDGSTSRAITVTAYPHGFLSEPATVMVTARVDPRPENRALVVMLATEDGTEQRTDRELWGENAMPVWTFTYRDLPAGTYTPIAIVVSVDAQGKSHETRAVGTDTIHVRSKFGEDEP